MGEALHALVPVPRHPAEAPALRVPVADDEDDIRALIRVAVAKAGGTVVATVADGESALSAGAVASLSKPFSLAGLVHQLRSVTDRQPA